jgi:hypothetical protein
MQAEFTNLGHELLEAGYVVNKLRLNEIRTSLDLLTQAIWSPLEGIPEGVGGGANEETRFDTFNLVAAFKTVPITHLHNRLNQGYRIQVMNVLSCRMIAEGLVIPGEAEQITHPQGIGTH